MKKKFLSAFLAAVMVFSLLPSGMFTAYADTSGYYTYEVINEEATITDVDESISGDVVIPSELGGYPVTSIGDEAFEWCDSLISIYLPESVTSIGSSIFGFCDYLETVTVSEDNPIYKSEGNCIIEKATNTLVVGCNNSTIPDDVEIIGENSFSHCLKLKSINIPNNVTCIEDWAFLLCSSLESIYIPSSVTSIGTYVFGYNSSLNTITVEDGNTVYKSEGNCIIEKETNTLIAGCDNSTIPDGVEIIQESAFYSCSNLTSIEIPSSVTDIAASAFINCSSLETITVKEGNSVYESESNCIIEKATNTLVVGCKNSSIPYGVEIIGNKAFYFCSDLTTVEIPYSVIIIEESAFNSCYSLKTVSLSKSVTTIENMHFPVALFFPKFITAELKQTKKIL